MAVFTHFTHILLSLGLSSIKQVIRSRGGLIVMFSDEDEAAEAIDNIVVNGHGLGEGEIQDCWAMGSVHGVTLAQIRLDVPMVWLGGAVLHWLDVANGRVEISVPHGAVNAVEAAHKAAASVQH